MSAFAHHSNTEKLSLKLWLVGTKTYLGNGRHGKVERQVICRVHQLIAELVILERLVLGKRRPAVLGHERIHRIVSAKRRRRWWLCVMFRKDPSRPQVQIKSDQINALSSAASKFADPCSSRQNSKWVQPAVVELGDCGIWRFVVEN